MDKGCNLGCKFAQRSEFICNVAALCCLNGKLKSSKHNFDIQLRSFYLSDRKIDRRTESRRLASDSCNISIAEGASNGAGEAAYLIRNKYSCHIPGAGWCQVFDCYPTPHVRERPGESSISTPCFKEV